MTSASIHARLKSTFANAIRTAFPKVGAVEPKIVVANPKFGDYQLNNAMDIFSK